MDSSLASVPPIATINKNGATHQWLILLTVIVGTFLGRLDQTIVNLALPKVIDDFHITVQSAGWIATAYILANAVFVPIWGKLGDTIGRKKVYVIGFVMFIVGSVLAGLAWNLGSMIVFRLIQAIAGSADYPTAMSIIAVTFKDPKKRGQALGIWSSSFAAATVFGPLFGGPLIDTFGWRSVFLVNLPVGILGLIMALTFIKESTAEKKTVTFDWLGGIALGITLSALVLVLDKGQDWGWLSLKSVISYCITTIFAAAFIAIEKKAAEPIINLAFFKNSVFVNTLLNNFVVFMGMMGSFFLIPVFAQTFLGYNATETGYLFIPMAVSIMCAAPLGGALSGKVQARYVIAASTLVAAFGLYLLSFLDPRSTPIDIMLPMFVMAFGMGFGMAQRTNSIASVVAPHEIGMASSVLALARNIAGAFGIALFGTLLTSTIKTNLLTISKESVLYDAVHSKEFVALVILKAQISAYATVFLWSAAVVCVGGFLALAIKTKKEVAPSEKIIVE